MDNKHLKFLMVMLTMLALGSILLVACSRPGTTTGGTTASGTQQPQSGTSNANKGSSGSNTVHMGLNNFTQPSITIPKGSKITLVDDAAVPHIIQNGTWNGSTPQPMKESGAPTVNQNFSGNDTHDVGPFTTAGTFKLYCTIHVGMNLTVTVK